MTSTFVKTLLPLTAFGCVQGNDANPKKQQKPNIIYIMCDDMGYGDLGCYGQQYILTPNIDRMAKEGMRFTQAYAGAPVSAPSRACFMTGQHSGHTEVRGNIMEKTVISALLDNILTTQNMLSYLKL